jgi:ABC-2 type transport system permease protein
MRGVLKIAWVETKLFVREPLTLIFSFGLPLLVLFVLAEVFGNKPDQSSKHVARGLGAINYYVPAYIGLVICAIGVITLPVHLAEYRERGVLRRFRAAGVSPQRLLGAQVIVSFALALISSVILAVAAGLAYSVSAPHSLVGVVGAFILVGLAFNRSACCSERSFQPHAQLRERGCCCSSR